MFSLPYSMVHRFCLDVIQFLEPCCLHLCWFSSDSGTKQSVRKSSQWLQLWNKQFFVFADFCECLIPFGLNGMQDFFFFFEVRLDSVDWYSWFTRVCHWKIFREKRQSIFLFSISKANVHQPPPKKLTKKIEVCVHAVAEDPMQWKNVWWPP